MFCTERMRKKITTSMLLMSLKFILNIWTDSTIRISRSPRLFYRKGEGDTRERKHSKYSEYIKEIKSIEMLNFHVQMQTKSRLNSIHGENKHHFHFWFVVDLHRFFYPLSFQNLTYIFHPSMLIPLISSHSHSHSSATYHRICSLHLHFAYSSSLRIHMTVSLSLSLSGYLSAHSCLVCTLIDHNFYGREIKCRFHILSFAYLFCSILNISEQQLSITEIVNFYRCSTLNKTDKKAQK